MTIINVMEKRKYLHPAMKETECLVVAILQDSPQAGGGEDPEHGGSIFGGG